MFTRTVQSGGGGGESTLTSLKIEETINKGITRIIDTVDANKIKVITLIEDSANDYVRWQILTHFDGTFDVVFSHSNTAVWYNTSYIPSLVNGHWQITNNYSNKYLRILVIYEE